MNFTNDETITKLVLEAYERGHKSASDFYMQIIKKLLEPDRSSLNKGYTKVKEE